MNTIFMNSKNSKTSDHIKRQIYSFIKLQHGMKNLNFLMDHILGQIFKIFLIYIKKHWENTVNPSIKYTQVK